MFSALYIRLNSTSELCFNRQSVTKLVIILFSSRSEDTRIFYRIYTVVAVAYTGDRFRRDRGVFNDL